MNRPTARARRHRPLAAAVVLGAIAGAHAAASPEAAPPRTLSICADPANLPFSNDRGEGFENRIAALLAADLQATPTYDWSPQRRGFLRRTLNAHACDLVMGAPVGLEGLSTTRPMYTSSYAFVTLRSRGPAPRDFDDPVLARRTIGLQALGADGANTPPAASLAARGLAEHVVGFPTNLAGEGGADIVDAVADGRVDVAVVWGPIGGYFARRHGDRLAVTPITGDARLPTLAYTFPIALGVRRGDEALKAEVQRALDRRRAEIDAILRDYGVPLLAAAPDGRDARQAADPPPP